MKSLFHGVIAESMIFPYPVPRRAEADLLHGLLGEVRKFFGKNVDSARIDREGAVSGEVMAGLRELGLFGIGIPVSYGGKGLSHTACARVVQELGTLDSSLAVTIGAHQFIGVRSLLLFGNDALKNTYLPKAATGECVCAFALSEAGAGSDAAALRTHAERDGDVHVLTGTKVWVTNGGIADLFTVFARTSPADGDEKPRITAFLVERAYGAKTTANEGKLGVRGTSTTDLILDRVRVPDGNVLHDPGRGFKVAMEVLNDGRLGMAAGCIGTARRLIKLATDRTKERRAFGRTIGEFGLIKDKIAQMMASTYALESMTYLTTGFVDGASHDYSIESAICKVFGSETLWAIANDALQIAAGAGYTQSQPFERLLRDARVNLIFTGTNEILRCFIALAGMQGPGKELTDVSRAMREPIKGFGLLSDFALRKAKTAFARDRMRLSHPLLARESVVLEEYAQDLARNVDKVLRKHGRNIAEMQFTQRRVADMAIDLYAVAATLARTTRAIEERGEEGARREIDMGSIFVATAEKRLRENAFAFDKNDDELRKAVAAKTYSDGGYPLDII